MFLFKTGMTREISRQSLVFRRRQKASFAEDWRLFFLLLLPEYQFVRGKYDR